ncbi:MAG: HlyD family efflux transporter periplasmic adaptor subunit [Arenibacter latericius]|nr:HlyD family efflux transporter periplasmic adaptor subunit [Arenibacter latericius]
MKDKDIWLYDESAYIKRKPTWMLRWGVLLLFGFFVMVLVFASFFSYNENLNASLVLTTETPPAHIMSKHTGRILDINNLHNDTVISGDILAVMESTGNLQDIMSLKNKLTLNTTLLSDLTILNKHYPSNLELGNKIRPIYNGFLDAYRNLILYHNLNDKELKEVDLKRQYVGKNLTIQNKKNEILILQRNLEINKTDYDRYVELFEKGVVSLKELERVEKGYLSIQRQYSNVTKELYELNTELFKIKNNDLLFKNSGIRNKSVHASTLEFEKQKLLAFLKEWEEMFVLKSPISGRISYSNIWVKNQNLKKGQVIFTVVPIGNQKLLGRCRVPIRNSGKIRHGQRVIIKLDNYPYREWGALNGTVKTISEVPYPGDNGGYDVLVEVEDLITTYGKTLVFKQEMQGNAKIVLAKVSLLKRVFYQFREIWEFEE